MELLAKILMGIKVNSFYSYFTSTLRRFCNLILGNSGKGTNENKWTFFGELPINIIMYHLSMMFK